MPIPSPDITRRIQQQMVHVDTFHGQAVTIRKYISASGASPEFGLGDTPIYQLRPSMAESRALRPDEIQMVGGQAYRGGYYFWTLDEVTERDEIVMPVVSGEVFRVATKPDADYLGGALKWGFIGLRAEVTGQF